MRCRIADMRCKEVINIPDGFRMGFVYDVLFDVCSGQIEALVVPGRCRFFGLFGREDDYVIDWDSIRKIGDDIILVEVRDAFCREKRGKRPWW